MPVAFCPNPPILVPALAAGAAAEMDAVRAACDDVVGRLVASADQVTVVGAGSRTRRHPSTAAGSLAGFGVHVRAGGPGEPVLPLSLTLGAWLLDRAGGSASPPRSYVELDPAARPGDAEVLGVLDGGPDGPDRVGWLVMGDGSARRDPKAPGALRPDAVGFDDAVAAALSTGDAAALSSLDRAAAADLMVSGAAPWAVVGAALAGRPVVGAQLLAHEAPYGVAYMVAWWP